MKEKNELCEYGGASLLTYPPLGEVVLNYGEKYRLRMVKNDNKTRR